MHLKQLVIATALFAAPLCAQQVFYVPSNTPGTGTCNVIPFGTTKPSVTWENQLYQTLVTDAELGSPASALPISGLAFSACPAAPEQFRTMDSITITMGQLPGGILGTTFAANLVNNVQVVLDHTDYGYPAQVDNWTDIGIGTYIYIPGLGDLVIQIEIVGNDRCGPGGIGFHRDSTNQRCFAVGWTGSPPPTGSCDQAALKMRLTSEWASIVKKNKPCMGLEICGTGLPVIGQVTNVFLKGAQPGGSAFVMFGTQNLTNPIRIPQAQGCPLYCVPSVFFPVPVLANGETVPLPLGIPNVTQLVCVTVCFQGLAEVPPGGVFALSDCLDVHVGLTPNP